MNAEAQRIAIAEACGWERGRTEDIEWVSDPHGIRREWSKLRNVADSALPDYLNDLNAMHEAEKALSAMQRKKYYDVLVAHIIGWDAYWNEHIAIHATAAQRAEAFLRTLNLWTDDA